MSDERTPSPLPDDPWQEVARAIEHIEEDIQYQEAMPYDVECIREAVDRARALTASAHQAEREEWDTHARELRQELSEARQQLAENNAILWKSERWLQWCDIRVLERAEASEIALAALRSRLEIFESALRQIAAEAYAHHALAGDIARRALATQTERSA